MLTIMQVALCGAALVAFAAILIADANSADRRALAEACDRRLPGPFPVALARLIAAYPTINRLPPALASPARHTDIGEFTMDLVDQLSALAVTVATFPDRIAAEVAVALGLAKVAADAEKDAAVAAEVAKYDTVAAALEAAVSKVDAAITPAVTVAAPPVAEPAPAPEQPPVEPVV